MRFYKKQLLAAQDARQSAKGATVEMQGFAPTGQTPDEEQRAGFMQHAEDVHDDGHDERYDARFSPPTRYDGHSNQYTNTYGEPPYARAVHAGGGRYNGLGVASGSEEDLAATPAHQPARWL